MRFDSTVFQQLLKLVPRSTFQKLADQHHSGRKLRSMTRWSQFIALSFAQLTGRKSLRDIEIGLQVHQPKLYHLGASVARRSSLARINENQSYEFYKALFGHLYQQCQSHTPKHRFQFDHKLYSLDASVIDLSLKLFPWAKCSQHKAAVKLHLGLDHDGLIPAVAVVTDGNVADTTVAPTLDFPNGSILLVDRGYHDFSWFKSLNDKGCFFVSRLKRGVKYDTVSCHHYPCDSDLRSDAIIELTSQQAQRLGMPLLRRVIYVCPKTLNRYVFLTNAFHLDALTIADLYKARWEVELFFKWIKQNLKIQWFLGTSKNAVLTQIWAALCVCLLVAYITFVSKTQHSMQQVLRLLSVTLFHRMALFALVRGDPQHGPPIAASPQLSMGFG